MPQPRSVRRRVLPGPSGTGKQKMFGVEPPFTPPVYPDTHLSAQGTQVTESEGHNWPPRKGEQFVDRGGSFRTTKSYMVGSQKMRNYVLTVPADPYPRTLQYIGPIATVMPGGQYSPYPLSKESTDSELVKKGTTAIALCAPTNPVSNVLTFLGELYKDGLPSLVGASTWKNRTDTLRKQYSNEYLNVQFGWRPLVNDIISFGEAVRKADTVLAQYERDAGKVVRRKFEFPSSTVTTTDILPQTGPAGPGGSFTSPPYGALLKTTEVVRRQWFSGAFTYYLPTGYDSRSSLIRHALEANKLFGTILTPEVLWNLAPWSWAVDWFSNTGDVIKNISRFATSGLVMRYGYMMEHTIVRDTYTLQQNGLKDRSVVIEPTILVTETKKRIQANPFGFGLTWNGLSPFQLSIAAALGFSRGK